MTGSREKSCGLQIQRRTLENRGEDRGGTVPRISFKSVLVCCGESSHAVRSVAGKICKSTMMQLHVAIKIQCIRRQNNQI